MVFGVISPNTRISRVSTPVAAPTALLPNNSIVNVVIIDDAERFTMLLPTRIILSILPGSSITFIRVMAFLSPASARVRILILLTVVSAVSAEEKNADKHNKRTTRTNRMPTLSPESNIKYYQSPFFVNCLSLYNVSYLLSTKEPSVFPDFPLFLQKIYGNYSGRRESWQKNSCQACL